MPYKYSASDLIYSRISYKAATSYTHTHTQRHVRLLFTANSKASNVKRHVFYYRSFGHGFFFYYGEFDIMYVESLVTCAHLQYTAYLFAHINMIYY